MIRIKPEQRRNLDRAAKQESQEQHHPSRRDVQSKLEDIRRCRRQRIQDLRRRQRVEDLCRDILAVVDELTSD